MSTTDLKTAEPTDDAADDALDAPVLANDSADDAAPQPQRNARNKGDEAREEAVKRYRELRADRERQAALDAGEEPAVDDDEPAVDAAHAPAEVHAATAAAPAEEPIYTLLVDGKPVQMKASEVIAKAQITVAADNRLDEAKRLLAEAKAIRSQSAPEHQPGQGDGRTGNADPAPAGAQDKANQSRPALDREKLRAIAQRIQVGDDDEGADAFEEFAAEIAARQTAAHSPDDIVALVNEKMSRQQITREITTAAETFKTTYPGIIQDQDMLEASFSRLRGKVREDLVRSGIDATQLEGLQQEQLFQLHQQQRVKGAKVRDYDTIFKEVGTEMSAKFAPVLAPKTSSDPVASKPTAQGAPPARSIAERVDRKRSASMQPRTAGARTPAASTSKPKSYADVIADMRRARGFSH